MTESRRGFGTDVALLVVARLSSVAALFGASVLAARLLPPEAVGSAAVGQTIGTIAALAANGGINIATIYFLKQEPEQAGRIVPRLVAVAAGAAAAAVVLVLLVGPVVLSWTIGEVDQGLLIAAALLGAGIIGFEFAGSLLLGLGRSGWYTLVELARGVGSLLAVAILLGGPWRDDAGFVLGLAGGYALAALVGLVKTARDGTPLRPRFEPAFLGRALGFGMRGQAGNVFAFIGVRLDLLLVPALIDLRAAGIYVVAVRTSDVIGQVATAASSLAFPRVAETGAGGTTEFTERTMRMTLFVMAILAVILAIAAEPVLSIVFGEVYAAGTPALIILLIAALPLAMGRILSADLKGRGRPGLVSWASLVTLLAIVVLDLALIPTLGLVGAAVASLLAYTAGTAALLIAYRSVTSGRLAALLPTPADARALVSLGRRIVASPRPGQQ